MTSNLNDIVLLICMCCFQPLMAQDHLAGRQGNPIIPGYFADPTVKKFGDTYYIYATTDGNGGGFGPSQVWISKDFVNWTMQDMNWPTTHHYWAPDATQGPDGRYYLYYCQPVEIFGASAKTPVGPWTSLLPAGKAIVPNFLVPNVITLDGQTFKDDDGKYYMYWGTWGIYPNHGCGVGLLNPDMKSFSKLAQIPNTDAKEFFEAPFVFKRKGIYYLTYSSGYCEDGTYRVQYATAKDPMGPFTYGTNNPVLSTTKDGTVHGPGHQSVLQEGDDFYLVYHRHNNPHNDGGYHRQVAADKIIFDSAGNILKLVPTHSGIGYLGKNQNPHKNLAYGKRAAASSSYDADFKAEYALDDNNGTLWKARNNVGPSWLQVDLGQVTPVRSVHTQFEYATWYYQYKIEYSLDGKAWKVYADRSRNTRHGSPMIDFGDVRARYLRTTILRTEYPGLNKAIWNMKVFDDASYKPVMNTKIKPWKSLAAYQSRGLLVDLNIKNLRPGATVRQVQNAGKLGGVFRADGVAPVAFMVMGKKALVFHGGERLSSSVMAPASLLGNSSYSVSMWVLNPEIDKEENILFWTKPGGNDLSNVRLGYGSSKRNGATTHLGWADLGFKELPKANAWHHIAMVFDGTMERIYVDGKLDRSERRMLFVNNLSRFVVGGDTEGLAGFSGALASLQVYDVPLAAGQIEKVYRNGLDSGTPLFAEARRLEYGVRQEWTNDGSALGKLTIEGKLEVSDFRGKIAVRLDAGANLNLDNETLERMGSLSSYTAVFTLLPEVGATATLYFVPGKQAVRILGNGKWQQVVCVYRGGKVQVYVDGTERRQAFLSAKPKAAGTLVETKGNVAIASIQVYNHALKETQVLEEYRFWKSTLNKQVPRAFFTKTPVAVTPNMVQMTAGRPLLPGSDLEYLFIGGPQSSGKWVRNAAYTDFSVAANGSYRYTVKVRDNYGNVTRASGLEIVSTDPALFAITVQAGSARATPMLENSLSGTSWAGFEGTADTVIQESGVLKMVSHNTAWDGSGPKGPFAYNLVSGDFVAEVTIADLAGLAEQKTQGANEGGLMVKIPNSKRKLLQSGIMPGWGIGNIVTDLNTRERRQSNNQTAWSFYKHLQIQRIGKTFMLRGSSDKKNWVDLPGSPITWKDMPEGPLQVGLYHATYGDRAGYASFADFKIIQRK